MSEKKTKMTDADRKAKKAEANRRYREKKKAEKSAAREAANERGIAAVKTTAKTKTTTKTAAAKKTTTTTTTTAAKKAAVKKADAIARGTVGTTGKKPRVSAFAGFAKATGTLGVDPKQGDAGMLILQIKSGRLGGSRRGDVDEIDSKADKTLLRLSKKLLNCAEFKAIPRHDSATKRWVWFRSLPSPFRAGIFCVKESAIADIDDWLTARMVERAELVEKFKTVYTAQIAVDKKRLGPQHNANDYPTVDELDEYYYFAYQYFELGPPRRISKIAPAIFKKERQKIADLIEVTKLEGVSLLRGAFAELVDHLLDRIKPDADGTKKRFHASNLGNIVEFIDTFAMRNIADDRELKRVLDDASKLLKNVNPDDIKNNDALREKVERGFKEVKKYAAALVKKAPGRRIDPGAFK